MEEAGDYKSMLESALQADGADRSSSDSESSDAPSPKRPRHSNFAEAPARSFAEAQADPNVSAEALLDELVAGGVFAGGQDGAGTVVQHQPSQQQPQPGEQRETITPIAPPPGVDPTRWKTVMCMYWQQGSCRRARHECSFAHGVEDMAPGHNRQQAEMREVTGQPPRTDFSSGLEVNRISRTYTIPEKQASTLMTDTTKQLLVEVTGASDVLLDLARRKITVTGSAVQTDKAGLLLQRVSTHCHWGVNAGKIEAILRPNSAATTARCTLSPMVTVLKRFSASLTAGKPMLSIGTDKTNHLVVKGPVLSRQHAVLEFVPGRGVVYICDTSTNGTFLNGRRLPEKGSAKVILWHGDELLLQDPKQSNEFGYIVNLEVD